MPHLAAGYIEVIHAHPRDWPFYWVILSQRRTRAISVGRRPWGILSPFVGLIPAPARHADLTPLFMWYVSGLMGVPLLLSGDPWSPYYLGLDLLCLFRLLDHDHLLLLSRFAMMAQAVGDLRRSKREVSFSG